MSYLMQISLIGGLAGVLGTGLGGLLTLIIKKPSTKTISVFLAFSGGIMLAIIFNDLIPEALEYGSLPSTFFGILLGIGLLKMLDAHLPHLATIERAQTKNSQTESRFLRTSLLLGLGIAMHNLPEGLAIGAGYMASESLGLGLAIAISIQNIPEGMAMASPMRAASTKSVHILLWTALAGLPMGLGAIVGAVIGQVSGLFLSISLGFAAGAMLYIIFDQLLPDAQELAEDQSATFGAIVGVLAGLVILVLVH